MPGADGAEEEWFVWLKVEGAPEAGTMRMDILAVVEDAFAFKGRRGEAVDAGQDKTRPTRVTVTAYT